MADLDKELSDIRREVMESRNLVIRADNQLKTLHAELKTVARRLDEAMAQQRLSSVGAYVLFALLAVGAGVLVSVVRGSVAAHEHERLSQQLDETSLALQKSQVQVTSAAAASRSASDVYRLLAEGSPDERLAAVSALSKLDQAHLTPLERRALQERLELTRRELGASALERGRQASRRGEAAAVSEELSRFLAMDPPEPEALEASFLLGTSYARNGRPQDAIPLLSRVVDKEKNPKRREEAMALLALAYEQTGQPERAAQVARSALEASPDSPWAPAFRSRLAASRRALAADAGVAAPPAGILHPAGDAGRAPAGH